MNKFKIISVLAALALSASAASCANSDSSSQEKPVTTTTTTAEETTTTTADPNLPPPAEGDPNGKYIFTQIFSGDTEQFLNVDIDPETIYIAFKSDGTGMSANPGGEVAMKWSGNSITLDGGSKSTFVLEGDKLTVTEGTNRIIYVHESAYDKEKYGAEKPEGKYGFTRAHNDGTPLEYDDVTAENTYMIFNSDGTGTASTASGGTMDFTWSDGHIKYSDSTEHTYVLRGDELTIFGIQETIIMTKVKE